MMVFAELSLSLLVCPICSLARSYVCVFGLKLPAVTYLLARQQQVFPLPSGFNPNSRKRSPTKLLSTLQFLAFWKWRKSFPRILSVR